MVTKHKQRIDLAVHALWYMAFKTPQGTIMIRDIAAKQNISESYLAKVFQSLAKTDVVISVRGKNGGYRLGRPASEISIGDVVRALENHHGPHEYDCNCESRGCPITPTNCLLPAIFEEARKRMFSALDTVTLEDLSAQLENRDVEVAWIGKNHSTAPGIAGSIQAPFAPELSRHHKR